MGKKTKLANFWLRRRSHIPFIVIGSLVVLMLYFNEETSVTLNMEYDKRISELKKAIKLEKDRSEEHTSELQSP